MANDIDTPPLYDILTKLKVDKMSDVWVDWFATFYQTLIEYLSQNGIFVPKLTAAQRNAIQTPVEGQMIYNTDIPAPQIFQNGAWKTFTTT
jgi:hypothetical protein